MRRVRDGRPVILFVKIGVMEYANSTYSMTGICQVILMLSFRIVDVRFGKLPTGDCAKFSQCCQSVVTP
jgi:hypothetical protein